MVKGDYSPTLPQKSTLGQFDDGLAVDSNDKIWKASARSKEYVDSKKYTKDDHLCPWSYEFWKREVNKTVGFFSKLCTDIARSRTFLDTENKPKTILELCPKIITYPKRSHPSSSLSTLGKHIYPY